MTMQISEIVPDFLIAKEVEEGCSSNTIRAYRYDLLTFQNTLQDMQVDQIQIFHVRKVLQFFQKKAYSKRAIARKIACFRSFFDFCLVNELLIKNPMRAIKSPKIRPEEALPKFLSSEDMEEILTMFESVHSSTFDWRARTKIIIRLMYASMARVSEICGLRISDVNQKNHTLKVRGKGNKERYIPLDVETGKILQDHIVNRLLETSDTTAYLFINKQGRQLQARSIQRDIHRLKDLLDYPVEKKLTPHIFRHTGATHLRQNGMDISELQDLLGHASPNTTRIYAKNDIRRLQTSYDHHHPLSQPKP